MLRVGGAQLDASGTTFRVGVVNSLSKRKGVPVVAALRRAAEDPQPEVHIRGDAAARYEFVGRTIFACQRAGIAKISFVTEPPARN